MAAPCTPAPRADRIRARHFQHRINASPAQPPITSYFATLSIRKFLEPKSASNKMPKTIKNFKKMQCTLPQQPAFNVRVGVVEILNRSHISRKNYLLRY